MKKDDIQNSIEKYKTSRGKVNNKYAGLNKKDHKFSQNDMKIRIKSAEKYPMFMGRRIHYNKDISSHKNHLYN